MANAVISLRPPGRVRSSLPPFLRVPPFPGAKVKDLETTPQQGPRDVGLIDKIRRLRVGGNYWGPQPALPAQYTVVRHPAALQALSDDTPSVVWVSDKHEAGAPQKTISTECDPWHVLENATLLLTTSIDEMAIVAAIMGVPIKLFDPCSGRLENASQLSEGDIVEAISATAFICPFSGEPMTVLQAVELCGHWRQLIDSNRDIVGALGFAFWKRQHVAPLLWGGGESVNFLRDREGQQSSGPVAVWRSKAPPDVLKALEAARVPLIEVEDGFLRSQGLGTECVPPLSIIVDRHGAYFDPSGPSCLENILQHGIIDEAEVVRASALRHLIIGAGLSKYDRATGPAWKRPAGERRCILVPGQVEDDRSVQLGGCGLASNLELLQAVRRDAPEAYIIYKPHPDVFNGHRKGYLADSDALGLADEIVTTAPIVSLIASVDEVHVNTSLAGFEALLRDVPVTTYGVPFYAGWGLTRDVGPVPPRRTSRRTIDELAAAALLVYPRYIDPLTGLPCTAETVVRRLSAGAANGSSPIVSLRRFQGKVVRTLRGLVQ